RLDRRAHRHDPISLGGGTRRSLGGAGRRVGAAQGGCHCHRRQRGARRKAGVVGSAHRLRTGGRSGWHGLGREPGATVTGLAMQTTDLVGKRLSLLREVIPNLRRLAIMANVEYPFAALEMAEAQTAAGTLGLDAAVFEIRRAEDIAPAFEALKDRAD